MPSELNSILYMLIIFLGLFVVMTFGGNYFPRFVCQEKGAG